MQPVTTVAALQAFVDSYRAVRSPPPADRLADFVRRWRVLAPSNPLQANARPTAATVERLKRVTGLLGPAFERARATGASANVWKVAGLGRDERRNSAALAWLLDPRGSHGWGSAPLAAFLEMLCGRAPDLSLPESLGLATVRTERRPMNSERDRVDIVIDHPALLLMLEIKIDAGQGVRQLDRYREAAAETARCTGRPAWRVAFLAIRPAAGIPEGVISLSWRDLVSALQRTADDAPPGSHVTRPVRQLLQHFLGFQEAP